VVDAGSGVSARLASPLAQQGFAVAVVSDQSAPRESGIVAVNCRFETRATVDQALAAAATAVGKPQLLVLSLVPRELMKSTAIADLPAQFWTDSLHTAAISTIYALQAAHDLLAQAGGAIVFVGPAMSLVGASGLCALSTLLESQRSLAKSAARQWGQRAIRVHWVGLGVAGNYMDLESTKLPVGPELGPPPPALGRVPTADSGVAELIALLAADGASALTGSTLVVDGGEWMVP
jgi:NAD(P)-dependent dehydrogenase (short-subunit alcohol dehydrogenase family)